MYESLILSIKILQKSKYAKGNKKQLAAIMNALNRAKVLFPLDIKNSTSNQETSKIINFRNTNPNEQNQKILEEFINDFEKYCLQSNNGTPKNFLIFSVTAYKIIRTISYGRPRGLLSAHMLNKLNEMLVKHPVKFNTQATNDPLGLFLVISELAIDVENNLNIAYEFDETLLNQFTPLLQKCYIQSDNSIKEILDKFSSMTKFKLNVQVGTNHKKIIEKFLTNSISQIPLDLRINKVKIILGKMIEEQVNQNLLDYYDLLKITFEDRRLQPQIVKLAKSTPKTNRRFIDTILEEMSML